MTDSPDQAENLSGTPVAQTPSAKKTYKTPTLQRFGTLSRLTQGSAGTVGDGGAGKKTKTGGKSDRRLKRNIVRVGTLPQELGLYLFDYISECRKPEEQGRQLGVMADEVERVLPDAVTLSPEGFQLVDYSLLDIQPADVIAAFNR
jgi:hypothetical protein